VDLQERVTALLAASASRGTALEQLMLREPILQAAPLMTANPGASTTLLVVFESRRNAIFKPFTGQNHGSCAAYNQEPFEAVLHEVAAWRLAATLGPPWDGLLPAAVFRNVGNVGSGVLINRRIGTPDLNVLIDAPAQADAAAFWDALVGQQDRHANNFRYEQESRSLALIDHGFCFGVQGEPCNADIFCEHRRSQNRTALTQAELNALTALLASSDLHGLRNYIEARRADALQRRAEAMKTSGQLPATGAF
jgi:hypothetical protein